MSKVNNLWISGRIVDRRHHFPRAFCYFTVNSHRKYLNPGTCVSTFQSAFAGWSTNRGTGRRHAALGAEVRLLTSSSDVVLEE